MSDVMLSCLILVCAVSCSKYEVLGDNPSTVTSTVHNGAFNKIYRPFIDHTEGEF